MNLIPTEQQAVKEAAVGHACEVAFRAGIDFALSTLFEPRCVAFHDWVRDNTVADGAPKLFYKLDSKRYTTFELYSIYNEQLNKQQDEPV